MATITPFPAVRREFEQRPAGPDQKLLHIALERPEPIDVLEHERAWFAVLDDDQ
jgi:hypothetical protein